MTSAVATAPAVVDRASRAYTERHPVAWGRRPCVADPGGRWCPAPVRERRAGHVTAMQGGDGSEVGTSRQTPRLLVMGPILEEVAGIQAGEQRTVMAAATPEGRAEWASPAAVTSKLEKKRSLVCEEYSY